MRALLRFSVMPLLLVTETLDRPLPVAAQQLPTKITNPSEPRVSVAADGPHYVAVAFHDVVDRSSEGDDNAVTASNLVSFFEWMHANSWTAITLDDIDRAKSGARPLPDRAVLITFDDGYRSLYTRVYPLLLVYKVPIVAAIVGSWIQGPKRETIRKGDDLIPGSDALITWEQAREMARSGLVEFASHTYNLHHSHVSNPQGGTQPAVTTPAYDPEHGYESVSSYRQRLRADFEQSRALMQTELGRAPRAFAWPFGRYTRAAQEEALAAGYQFLLTMDPEPGFPEALPQVPRLLPVRDPGLPTMVTTIVPDPPTAVRLVRLDPRLLVPENPTVFEKNLGAAIERVRMLGATTVIVEAGVNGTNGRLEGVWFPTRLLPVRADALSRIVWQMRTRARVQVAVSLPVRAAREALGSDTDVLQLFQDLGFGAQGDALFVGDAPGLAAIPLETSARISPWEVRRRRNAMELSHLSPTDALALQAFFAFERVRPEDRLYVLSPAVGNAPSGLADLTLVEAPLDLKSFREVVDNLVDKKWLGPDRRYSCGILIRDQNPPSAAALSAAVRLFQRHGGVAFGWEQDDPIADEPKAALAAPSVSAARFPVSPLRKP
jgi:peptidoglycan/xylan/chitin deacetylase (PgdA/CDA1 family)